MSTPTVHSEHGASKAKRWLACPGSIRMERGLPDVSSEAALTGTAAHALAEECLRTGLDAFEFVGATLPVLAHRADGTAAQVLVLVDDDMVDAVQVYLDFVRENTRDDRALEVRFDLSKLKPPVPMFGTSDCVSWRKDDTEDGHLHVIDYKHGSGVLVEVEANEQGMYYALGAVVHYGIKPSLITITIVQPRAVHEDGVIRSYTFGWPELVAFKRRLFEGAAATLEPDAPLVPGEHCRFCKAAAICPAQRSHAVALAQVEFDVVPVESVKEFPSPALLTADQLGAILDGAPIVEAWFNAVRSHVEGLLEAGVPVEGYKLVDKRAMRKWTDEEEVKNALGDLLGDSLYTRKLVSPAQAEKALKPLKHKLPSGLVKKESSGRKLVPDTDARPALPPSAQTDFSVEQ